MSLRRGCPSNFNPRAPCGARRRSRRRRSGSSHFNPRAPCGARLLAVEPGLIRWEFQSTRPVRGATTEHGLRVPALKISIHAPRAGRDSPGAARRMWRADFNPRAPCGARLGLLANLISSVTFQSTRPVRGATFAEFKKLYRQIFQSTRPVRGATTRTPTTQTCHIFQSTRPVRGATRPGPQYPAGLGISIHAPRAGRDPEHHGGRRRRGISIHAPRAGRDEAALPVVSEALEFQSTRPVRGATRALQHRLAVRLISIHAPRAGRD